jgi:Tfp pilus assembly protein PilX
MIGDGFTAVRGRLRKVFEPTAKEGGVVLVTVLLVTFLLLLKGLAFLTMSATENAIAHNGVNRTRAFEIAEGGLSHARRYLTAVVAVTNLDPLLAGTSGNPVPLAVLQDLALVSGEGTYSVSVANNTTAYQGIPADPDPEHDTDNRIWVTAAGTFRNATQTVRALVEVNPLLAPPAAIATFDNANAGEPVQFDFKGDAFEITGLDIPPPASTATCGIPADKIGIAVSSANSYNQLDGEIKAVQKDNISGISGDKSIAEVPWLDLATLQRLKKDLVSQATVTWSGFTTIHSDIGTPTGPVIAHTTDSLDLQGGGKGYGILIVEGSLRMRGTFTWEGLILVVGQGEFEIAAGASVYGSVLVAHVGNSGKTKIKVGGNSTVAFSRQALCRTWAIMPTTILAWQQL